MSEKMTLSIWLNSSNQAPPPHIENAFICIIWQYCATANMLQSDLRTLTIINVLGSDLDFFFKNSLSFGLNL